MGSDHQFFAVDLVSLESVDDRLDGSRAETAPLVCEVNGNVTQLAAAVAMCERKHANDDVALVTNEKGLPPSAVRAKKALGQDDERHRLAGGDECNLIVGHSDLDRLVPVAFVDEFDFNVCHSC